MKKNTRCSGYFFRRLLNVVAVVFHQRRADFEIIVGFEEVQQVLQDDTHATWLLGLDIEDDIYNVARGEPCVGVEG